MTFSEFIVPISGASNDNIIIERAAKLFGRFKVPTTLLFLEPDPNTVLGWSSDGMVAGYSATLVDAMQNSQNQLWQSVLDWSKQYDFFAIERIKGLGEGKLSERAIIGDLMLVSNELARGEGVVSGDFETALMGENIPALVLHDCASFEMKNCMVAWNGSPQAARALKAAVPFLKGAKKVTIIHIENGSLEQNAISDPEFAQKFLAQNHVDAKIEIHKKSEKSVGADLINHANRLGVDLIVAGAYGHSRAREFIFGGATKCLLKSQTGINLLISH